jgi:hypothetical protein
MFVHFHEVHEHQVHLCYTVTMWFRNLQRFRQGQMAEHTRGSGSVYGYNNTLKIQSIAAMNLFEMMG